jgi:flagellar P-ring protein precursor FlgI
VTVQINEKPQVTQGSNVVSADGTTTVTPADPVVTPNSAIAATQTEAKAFVFDAGVSLASLVDAINAVGASPGDLVAILEALKEAGALRAELVVI